MNSQTKTIVWIFAALGTLWDIITTFSGMYEYSGQSGLLAIILTFFINGVIIMTFMKIENVFIAGIGIICLIFAFFGDFSTAFNGNMDLMKHQQGEDGKGFIAFVMTVVTVACSFISSYLIFRGAKTENTKDFHRLFATDIHNKHMCKHLVITPDGISKCEILMHKEVPLQVRTEIQEAFEAASKKNKPDYSKGLGNPNGADRCPFHNSPYANWKDCPHYLS